MQNSLNIDDMPAGREMDALIAETAMEWKWGAWDIKTNALYGSHVGFIPVSIRTVRELESSLADWQRPATGTEELNSDDYMHVPNFSTDIAPAWKVIEKLKEHKPIMSYDPYSGKWYVRFNGSEYCSGDTAPLAICRAAYKIAINKVP